jgi:hypothetical protein
MSFGGRSGIRTHGRLAPTAVFKTAALNHSAILPNYCNHIYFSYVNSRGKIPAKTARGNVWVNEFQSVSVAIPGNKSNKKRTPQKGRPAAICAVSPA